MRKVILFLLLVVVLACAGSAVAVYWLTQPVQVAEDTFVEITRGTSTRGIANQLAQ